MGDRDAMARQPDPDQVGNVSIWVTVELVAYVRGYVRWPLCKVFAIAFFAPPILLLDDLYKLFGADHLPRVIVNERPTSDVTTRKVVP
jgi:hypothetical protein